MTIEIYLHSSKESMYDKGHRAGLTGKALDYFKYACEEVKLTLEVNSATGEAKITKVDDRPVG